MRHPPYPRSSVLVIGQTSVHALLPSALIAQVECFLENGKLLEAAALLDRSEVEIAGGETGSDQTEAETLQYLHQCIAFTFLRQTRFREATQYFVKGKVDPRLLIFYFDELTPALFDASSGSPASTSSESLPELKIPVNDLVEVDVWAGVAEHMPHERSIDDTIRNYSPYLRQGTLPAEPSEEVSSMKTGPKALPGPIQSAGLSTPDSGTRTHAATVAIREGLRAQAEEMVKNVLVDALESERWGNEVIEISSTALALLYAHMGDVTSLNAMFAPRPPRVSSRSISRPPSRHGLTSPHGVQGPSPRSDTGVMCPPSSSATLTVMPAFRIQVVVAVLARLQLWGVLVELWKVVGDAANVVQVLVSLVDGTHVDSSVPDPLTQIFAILEEYSPHDGAMSMSEPDRRALIKQWGAWLAVRDVERGMNLLTSIAPRTRQATGVGGRKVKGKEEEQELADELAILSELKAAEANDKCKCTGAAKRYLEWLTIGRGWEYRPLQDQLVQSCIGELLECLKDETVVKLWRAKAASYASSSNWPSSSSASLLSSSMPSPARSSSRSTLPPPRSPIPSSSARSSFLSYFASTTPDSPSKRTRIKALLVLQAMTTESAEDVKKRLVEGGWEKVLGLEMAVLSSKLSSTRTTFRALHALRDTSTAEAYALSGGNHGVVSARVGMNAAEGCGLNNWARWFGKCAEGGLGMERETECSMTPREMLQVLVEVYIEEGDVQQASRLLSSQGARLDAAAIISLVPTGWPLHSLTPFLTCSFRCMLHTAHEAQIVRAISAGQNLATFEQSYVILRDEGAIIEEALSDDEEGAEFEKVGGGDDTESLDEKLFKQDHGLHLDSVVDMSVHR